MHIHVWINGGFRKRNGTIKNKIKRPKEGKITSSIPFLSLIWNWNGGLSYNFFLLLKTNKETSWALQKIALVLFLPPLGPSAITFLPSRGEVLEWRNTNCSKMLASKRGQAFSTQSNVCFPCILTLNFWHSGELQHGCHWKCHNAMVCWLPVSQGHCDWRPGRKAKEAKEVSAAGCWSVSLCVPVTFLGPDEESLRETEAGICTTSVQSPWF